MNPSKHITVIMHNVEYVLMKSLIDFMYLGEVLVDQNNVDDLYKLAKTFGIQGFQDGLNKNEVSINTEFQVGQLFFTQNLRYIKI